jgi:hypothetical protein
LDGLTPDQLERPGVADEGRSIKDLLWHLAFWCDEAARVLGEMRAGTWSGEDPSLEPGWTDRTNREGLERSRMLDPAAVRIEWRESHRRMLEALGSLSNISPEAEEWFDESGPMHHAEHEPGLREWIARLRRGA